MKKNLLQRFIATLMLLAVSTLSWAYDFASGRIYYKINSDKTSVTVTYETDNSYSGSISIPSKVTYNSKTYNVTSIGGSAFYGCSGLTSVTIPNSVTSIRNSAFSGCSGLTSVTIPNSVTSIGKQAFYGCKGLTSVTIPNSVTSIETFSFAYCRNLESVIIGNSLTKIERYAFEECTGLTSVTFGKKVTSIEACAFHHCSSLTSITIPNSVTNIGPGAFADCSGLTSITIPNSVTSIGDEAFLYCSGLTSVDIPNSVTSIGKSAFGGCEGLTSITVDESNSNYDSRNNCNAIVETKTNTLISGCVRTIIPNSVTSIGDYAFRNFTALTSVTIPNSVTSIGNSAFRDCSGLTSVTIPDNITNIESKVFYMCSGLTSIIIPNSVTSIGDLAFGYCRGLKSFTIPDIVTSIGDKAFEYCSGMTYVTIPESVTSIGIEAFQGCSSLKEVYCLAKDVPTTGEKCFRYASTSYATLYVPASSIDAYTSTAPWNDFCSILPITFEENGFVYKINPDGTGVTLMNCNFVNSATGDVLVPSTITFGGNVYIVTSIGSYAFTGCSGLVSVTIPNSVTSIGHNVFPTTTKIYIDKGMSLLIALWNSGINPYDLSTNARLSIPVILLTNSASSIHALRDYTAGDADIIASESFTINGRTRTGRTANCTGLTPETNYPVSYTATIKYAGETFTYTKEASMTTAALTLTTSQPKVISVGNAIVEAISNLDDMEENAGFEWRRTDWTDDFASNTAVAFLYEGTMEGYIRNLYTEKLWKVRPYYQDNTGKYYYGDWVGLDPTNTSYFEPTVHTYARIDQTENKVQISGYVQRGTDDVRKQGFKYWEQEDNARGAGISIPSGAKTVEADGRVMEVELTGLKPNTTYAYVAFVTTVEGETFYGKQLSFTTGDDPEASITGDANGNGVVEIGDVTSVLTLMATPEATGYDNKAADANGNGVIEIGDVTTILTIMAKGGE